jgi:hypothetical protein
MTKQKRCEHPGCPENATVRLTDRAGNSFIYCRYHAADYGGPKSGYRHSRIAGSREGAYYKNPCRSNPTKKQKREKARKASVQRRVAVALAKFLKQANPAMKTAGASIQRLKGGVLKITPIKANTARGGSRGAGYWVEAWDDSGLAGYPYVNRVLPSRAKAEALAAALRRKGYSHVHLKEAGHGS